MKKILMGLALLMITTFAHGASPSDDLLNYLYEFQSDDKMCTADFASQLPFAQFTGYGTVMVVCTEISGFSGTAAYSVSTYSLDKELVKISDTAFAAGGVSGTLYEVHPADFRIDGDLYYIGEKVYVRTASGSFYEIVTSGVVAKKVVE